MSPITRSFRNREPERPESEVRASIKYPWVYDCAFRDTFWSDTGGSGTFTDIARCEFDGKLADGTWRHFTINYRIDKYDREMDVMKGFSAALEMAVEKGEIRDGDKIFKITEVRPVTVPEDQKKWLMKNRSINILEHHEDSPEDEAIFRSVIEGR